MTRLLPTLTTLTALAALIACDARVDYEDPKQDPDDSAAPEDTGGSGDDTGVTEDDTGDDTGGVDDTGEVQPEEGPWSEVLDAELLEVGGPPLVLLWDLDSHGSTVVGLDGQAAWVSTDDGLSWTRSVPEAGFGYQARSVAVTAEGIFVATWYDGVWWSGDAGGSWTDITGSLRLTTPALASDGESIYAVGTDGVAAWTGGDWDARTAPFPFPSGMIVDGETLYLGQSWVDDLYVSEDGGRTWSVRNADAAATFYQSALSDQGWLLGMNTQGDVRRSTDGGRTFIDLGPAPTGAEALFVHEGDLYARVRQDGVWVSHDDGQSWSVINDGLPEGYARWIYDMIATDSGALLIGTQSSGAWRSDDGETWGASSQGMGGGTPGGLSFHDGVLVGAFGLDQLWSYEAEVGWTQFGDRMANAQINRVLSDGDAIVISTSYDGAWTSADGSAWTRATGLPEFNGTAGPQVIPASGLAAGGEAMFMALPLEIEGSSYGGGPQIPVGGGVARSLDGGQSWTWMTAGMTASGVNDWGDRYYPSATAVGAWADVQLLGTSTNGVLRSADGGQSWLATVGLPSYATVTGLTRAQGVLYASVTDYASDGSGVWRSTDGGASWEMSSEGLGGTIAGLTAADGVVFALVTDDAAGVYRFDGETWEVLAEAPSGMTLTGPLVVEGEGMFVGTYAQGVLQVAPVE
ncbi:MAG: hypothetical protein H6739_29640 [Alphaproteobacteria bacterium]|nr:hypothetical protein [Alphaproteobacteria bacterium]